MKKNGIEYAGPSKKMQQALENEGLRISWPENLHDEEELAIEGMFYTGNDWEKLVLIDLRDKFDLSTKHAVDGEIANELQTAYDNFDIDEEMKLNMEGTAAERAARGVPEAVRLLEDMQEQDKRLKRFAVVANAVAEGKPIPPKPVEQEDGEDVHITPEMAGDIVAYLGCCYKMMNNVAKGDFAYIACVLSRKIGKTPPKWAAK